MDQPATHDARDGDREAPFPAPSSHDLTITVGHDDGRLVLHVEGDVDIESARHFSDFLTAAVEQSGCVVVDLRGVAFIDSTGLAALVGANNRARDSGGQLALRHPAPQTLKVLKVSGLDRIVPIELDGQSR